MQGPGVCVHCGRPQPAATPLCGYCGRPVGGQAQAPQPQPGAYVGWNPSAAPAAAPPHAAPPPPNAASFAPHVGVGGTALMPSDPTAGGPEAANAGSPPPAPMTGRAAVTVLRLSSPKLLSLAVIAAAAALFVTRFVPIAGSAGGIVWSWTPGIGVFQGMVWPLLMALAFGGIAFGGLLRTAPMLARSLLLGLGWLSACITSAAFPAGLLGGGAAQAVGALFPLLLVGLYCRTRDQRGLLGPILIGVGALGTGIAGLTFVDQLFAFSRQPVGGVLHNILWFIVLLAVLASAVLALPSKVVPALATVERAVPAALLLFVAWLPLSALLTTLTLVGLGNAVGLLSLLHFSAFMLAFVVVPLLASAEPLEAMARHGGRALAAAAQPPAPPAPPAPPPGVPAAGHGFPPLAPLAPIAPPTVEQQLAELDAAWASGTMTPNEYHARRNAILARR